ncbi:MAG: DNA-binding protein WhiA [Eubacterium sp.]|nr:DNA-binding protein WhiA [Eubacterium sp.]
MSFSLDLKTELADIYPQSVHCRNAELAGIICASGKIEEDSLVVRPENELIQKKIYRLARKSFDITEEMMYTTKSGGKNRIIIRGTLVDDLFSSLKLSGKAGNIYANNMIIERTCCKRAFIRGVFLAAGSVSSPDKKNHFEMVFSVKESADQITECMKVFDTDPKVVVRRNSYVVYIKDGDEIASILSVMGAVNSLMTFENSRIVKDIRNSINREVNCETANISKVASAAVKQIRDIEYIDEKMGRDFLPESLRDLADVRIANPLLSLKELGDLLSPPIGKSGVNHRLRRISELADKLRETHED